MPEAVLFGPRLPASVAAQGETNFLKGKLLNAPVFIRNRTGRCADGRRCARLPDTGGGLAPESNTSGDGFFRRAFPGEPMPGGPAGVGLARSRSIATACPSGPRSARGKHRGNEPRGGQ